MASVASEDVLVHILLKLPIKYLLRCRSVCKSWRSLISSPIFNSAHRNHIAAAGDNRTVIVRRCGPGTRKIRYTLHSDDDSLTEIAEFDFPTPNPSDFSRILGSVNGLICLLNLNFSLMLWNPAIRKTLNPHFPGSLLPLSLYLPRVPTLSQSALCLASPTSAESTSSAPPCCASRSARHPVESAIARRNNEVNMPTVSVGRDRLFDALGKTYEDKEFDDLCFRFGIELDDITTEKAIIRKEKHLDQEESTEGEEIIYKIEVPANRYDLLCLEGLAQALRVFEELEEIPKYTVANKSSESMLKMHVKPETSLIRPYVVCAVLRGVTFDEAKYNSFIDLQDRLHQNICRRRTLVAIGTHDLDTIQGPFTYEALPPGKISFVPLKQVKEICAPELMEFYKSDSKLKKFLHIIENSPVYPVLYDCNRTVLSLPPIINGAHSAITLKTKNVFIECTATDLTKAKIVLNTLVAMFSGYCERKFEVEPVQVMFPDGKSYAYPDLSLYNMEVSLSYINEAIGISLEAEEVNRLLKRMQLHSKHSISADKCIISVAVPPTRSDILHPCDVMEDVAIAFGYNEIPKRRPASLKAVPLNELSDLIRSEIAMSGFTEVLTWILCSHKENFDMLNRLDDGSTAVIIGNPRSSDFEVVRTSLMPGILKIVGHNKDHPKPIKIFEVGDIAVLDDQKDVGATNRRLLAALYCGATSGFELIHGLLDRVMEVVGTPFVSVGNDTGYYIELSEGPEFLTGRQASIIYKGNQIGIFGIVHPELLNNFDIPDPCSYLELNMESFL